MAENQLPENLQTQLANLALIADEDIDTSDAPEITDWSQARRAAFFEGAINNRQYDVRAIANWFLDRLQRAGIGISNLSLNKLIYFAVERSLVERGILLTSARIEAWDHGPVFREVYHAFKGRDRDTIRNRILAYSIPDKRMIESRQDFDADDLEFMDRIATTYGSKTAGKLVDLSHRTGGPWSTVWNYRGRINPGMEITSAIILRKAPLNRQVDG